MDKQMKLIIDKLIEQQKTIATMESCTGGTVSNAITNIAGASEVFSFSAITYSNEYKIKMGVPEETIKQFTVYSTQTANAMAKAISDYTNATYGVGITGKLNKPDKNNPTVKDNIVYFTIYDRNNDKYYSNSLSLDAISRKESKDVILFQIIHVLLQILEK